MPRLEWPYPGFSPPPKGMSAAVIRFADYLRAHQIPVAFSAVLDALQGLTLIDLSHSSAFFILLRSQFVSNKAQHDRFRELFDRFWRAPLPMAQTVTKESATSNHPGCGANDAATIDDAPWSRLPPVFTHNTPGNPLCYSPYARVHQRHAPDPASDVSAEFYRTMEKLLADLALHPHRRYRVSHRGRHMTLEGVLRRNLRHGGEPLLLAFKQRKKRPRRIIAFCDVSGSMDSHLLMVYQFLHVLTKIRPFSEIFFFSTELSRMTDVFRERRFSDALHQIWEDVIDWGGGTRIGHCLRIFNDVHSRGMLSSRSLVMIYSDGWDRGDTRLLADQMALLKRKAGRVLWLNPLLGTRGYRPLCRGMRAALPHTDYFLPAALMHDFYNIGNLLNRLCR